MATYYAGNESDLVSALENFDSSFDIVLTGSFSISRTISITGKVSITSDSSEPHVIYSNFGDYSLRVWSGASLLLGNVTLDGSGANDSGGVLNDGTLTMDGATITNFQFNNYTTPGAGVNNYGTFTLISGAITHCTLTTHAGAGVNNYGKFKMTGGEITHCTTTYSGSAVVNRSGGTFVMSGGLISYNSTRWDGGGVYNEAAFEMTGGEISHNTADYMGGGVFNENTFTMTGGEISYNETGYLGGGIMNYAEMTLSGKALITANRSEGYGGGISTGSSGGTAFNLQDSVVISYNTATYGGGIMATGSFNMSGGEIAFNNAEMDGGGIYLTHLNAVITGGNIHGNSATDGGGIYMYPTPYRPGLTVLDISGRTMITDNVAGNDGGGIWVNHDNLKYLDVGSPVVFYDNKAAKATERNPKDNQTYFEHIHCSYWTHPLLQGYNNVDIAYPDGTEVVPPNYDLHILDDFDPPKKAVRVLNTSNYPVYVALTLNEALFLNGESTVPAPGSGSGWITHLKDTDSTGDAYIHQYFQWVFGSPVISRAEWEADKRPSGRFWIYDPATGLIYWGQRLPVYEETGNLLEAVNQIGSLNANWRYFIKPQLFMATVRYNDYNVPVNDPYRWSPIDRNVVNEFSGSLPTPTTVSIAALKSAVGATLPGGKFEFGVFDENGNLVVTATSDAYGYVTFPALPITEAGTETYTVRELTPGGGGWTSDLRAFPAVVTAVDGGSGSLSANVTYPYGVPSFTNVYSSEPTSEGIVAYKAVQNWDGSEQAFEFGLYDASGSLLEVAQNSGGVVQFSQIPYNAAGVYGYSVREITASGSDWLTDGSSYPAVVTVTDSGSGQLISSVSYPNGQPSFTNTYTPPEPPQPPIPPEPPEPPVPPEPPIPPTPPEPPSMVCVTVCAKKIVCGADIRRCRFTFAIFDDNCNEISRASNDACGNIAFPLPGYTQAGVHNLTVRELNGSGCGWISDRRVFRVVVTISSSAQSALIASVCYPDGLPTFVNRHC